VTADPCLVEIFNRVADDIETVHGPANLRTTEPLARRGDDPFMTAAWPVDGINHGFKIYDLGGGTVQVLAWAHAGDFASANIRLRSWDVVESALRAVLPPVLTQDRAQVVARPVALPEAQTAESSASAVSHPSAAVSGGVAAADGHRDHAEEVGR
jgi:hypothetical protein